MMRRLVAIASVCLLCGTAVPLVAAMGSPLNEQRPFPVQSTFTNDFPTALMVYDTSPFYALIATPIAVHYDPNGTQHLIPMYVKDPDNPSTAVQRAESMIGRYADYIVGGSSPERASLAAAVLLWDQTNTAVLLSDDQEGYNLGVAIAPLASYQSIPIIVAHEFDDTVNEALTYIGAQHLYVCGNFTIPGEYTVLHFTSTKQIQDATLDILHNQFGSTPTYLTLTNPLDTVAPTILNSTFYEFNGTTPSTIVLPSQAFNMLLHGAGTVQEIEIPANYTYARVSIDLRNLNPVEADLLGDRIMFMFEDSQNETLFYSSTAGGIPITAPDGTIVDDRIHFETVIYNKPGVYHVLIYGQFFGSKMGDYNLKVRIDSLNTPIVPLMPNLSSLAPYLTAYHQGLLLANTSYAFALDQGVLYNGTQVTGVTQPGGNYEVGPASNAHTKTIHDNLNMLLAALAGIDPNDTQALREHYLANPVYLAIVADPTMVPMYFYHNPDGMADTHNGAIMGFYVPSDFYLADIDPKIDDPENDTFSYWPCQENIVGRPTGADAQDLSALLDRTFFYNDILDGLGSWKNNALVQTGCGLEFQNLPIFTKLEQIIYGGRGEPTKFPTGESWFINTRLNEDMQAGNYTTTSTMWLASQRVGFTKDGLERIKTAGFWNKVLFPKALVNLLDSSSKIKGGEIQMNNSLIFAFAHGFFNLYEFGDVFMDSRGFPGLSMWARIDPKVRSGLCDRGTYDLRAVRNMKYGPAVIYVESCITARTDGILGINGLSQAYLHAGVNAYIGSTRVTADPGYLDPRPFPNGLGFGILGLMKTAIQYKLKHQFPDLHFGAVIAENTINGLIKNDSSVGKALRDSKNAFLPVDANTTFLWSPPLTLSTGSALLDSEIASQMSGQQQNERTRVLDKKYVALHEFALYADPAFNPYQPSNEGAQ